MPDGVTITITGAKELAAKLDGMEKKLRRKVLNKAVRDAAKVIQAKGKANVPVRTGAMKKAIVVRGSKYVGQRKKKRSEVSLNAQIGKGSFKGDTFYGGFQEFGWKSGRRTKKIEGPDNRKQIDGKHFMERAYKSERSAALNKMLSEIAAGIEREAAK